MAKGSQAKESMKTFSASDVAQHNKTQDCWLIIGNDSNGGSMVVNVTKYLNDHPGGPEIMMEFAGKDADEMYEDIGHSKEARKKLTTLVIGALEVDPNAKKTSGKKATDVKSGGGGLNPLAIIVLLLAIACGVYVTQMKK